MQNFKILIISAVKICKHCLQSASASGGLRLADPLLFPHSRKYGRYIFRNGMVSDWLTSERGRIIGP